MSRPARTTTEALLVGDACDGALRTSLRIAGFSTVESKDAADALATLATRAFPIVILPLDVPGMETRDLVRRVRKGHPSTSVVLFARPQDSGRIVSALVHGIDAYITDPPGDEALLPTLHRAARAALLRAEIGDGPLPSAKLGDTERLLDEERARVRKLRARVKRLEASIATISTELRRVVAAKGGGSAATMVLARPEPEPDDEWSESSTTAARMIRSTDRSAIPLGTTPHEPIDDFDDDHYDATDPSDFRGPPDADPMFVGDVRDELSDLLRAPARRPPVSPASEKTAALPLPRSSPTTSAGRPSRRRR